MNDKLLNFLITLITGRVWCRSQDSLQGLDIWDCEPWMEFLRINFIPTIFHINKKIRLHEKYK